MAATAKQRTWNGGGTLPDKACRSCGALFYTRTGLAEHDRLGCRNGHGSALTVYRPRTYTEEGRNNLQERGRQVAAELNARRVRCVPCGRVSTPAGVALHQRATGHTGKEPQQ